MKLFLLTRRDSWGYDDYDRAVVCAPDEQTARSIHPNGGNIDWAKDFLDKNSFLTSWVTKPEDVIVEYLGEARPFHPVGVICASFNAG